MSTRPISCALVGLGRAGWHMHVEGLLAHEGFEIVAAADPDATRRAQAEDRLNCTTFANIDELLDAGSYELVIIATPTMHHFEDTQKAISSGAHCVLEKPITINHNEALGLARFAADHDRHIFAHHQHRFGAEYRHLRHIIDEGLLGPIFHIQACWAHYNRRWDWQTLRKNGGGLLANTCPHLLSILLPLLDQPCTGVNASIQSIKDAGDAEDHVNLLLTTGPSGPSASLMVTSAGAVPGTRWMLLGEYGSLSSDGTTSRLRYYDPAEVPPIFVLDEAAPERKYIFEELPWKEETRSVASDAASHSFYDNVHDVLHRRAPMEVGFDSAIEIMRVLDLARKNVEKDLLSNSDSRAYEASAA